MTPLTWSLLRCELVTICAGFSLDLICLWPGRIRPASLTRKSILTIAPRVHRITSLSNAQDRVYETTVKSSMLQRRSATAISITLEIRNAEFVGHKRSKVLVFSASTLYSKKNVHIYKRKRVLNNKLMEKK